ncbi:YwqG family protein [Streptomyces sp. CAU 1734]|uniref:YwqG family protein n=1 Tax=Streptomyces sp. CAU 1734 TaxID=3140360 RepID=UPI003260CDAE
MTHGSREALHDFAHQHLTAADAERWLGLLRPAFRLEPAGDDAPGPPAGRLGGLPELPADVEWPVWEGHGPLSFVASLDCAAVPPGALDIPLPAGGTLLFFYFDGRLDDGEALVLAELPESRPGSRVLHIPAGAAASAREAPAGLPPYPVVLLAGRVELTAADPWHPGIQRAFAPAARPADRYDHPVCSEKFLDALWDFDGETAGHQIGGHAHPVRNPVELEIAEAVLEAAGRAAGVAPRGAHTDGRRVAEEAEGWVLLAQFDSEDGADMMWGDCGALYWLIRPRDLAELRFDRAVFTWQCG